MWVGHQTRFIIWYHSARWQNSLPITYVKCLCNFNLIVNKHINIFTKMAVFWVVVPCSLVEVYQRFRGPCCLHHQGDEYFVLTAMRTSNPTISTYLLKKTRLEKCTLLKYTKIPKEFFMPHHGWWCQQSYQGNNKCNNTIQGHCCNSVIKDTTDRHGWNHKALC
jgi:hypothetical protein